MKRLILFELIILFLATTFESDSPPGWFQQTLPVNDQINDIFFLDSTTGWVVTDGRTNTNDTGYIMKTTDSGNSWVVQYNQPMKLNVVQFPDNNTGYVGGGSGTGTPRLYKTTNAGNTWFNTTPIGNIIITDMYFVNKDTGWACDDDPLGGGLWYTTNGSNTWQQQLGASFSPKRFFFINRDTGWVICSNHQIYKTINSGLNWFQQVNIVNESFEDVYFTSALTGWIHGGPTGIYKSTNGGSSWDTITNTLGYGTGKIFFVNERKGWIGRAFNKMLVTNDGQTWGYQTTPAFTNYSVYFTDTLKGWAGTNILIHTTDGGGPPVGIQQIGTEVPSEYKLFQNYPNPFNPVTIIKYQTINTKYVKLVIFDIQGRQLTELVNQKQSAGTYEADWKREGYSSGVYFYSLVIDGETINTEKMIFIQ